jgi:outer membrane protein
MKFIYTFILLFSLSLYAQTDAKVNSYSLEEAQKYAMENNHDIRSALLGIKAANKQVWEVTASGFPQLEISAQYRNLIDIPTQLIPGEIFGGEPGSTIPVKFGKPHNASFGVTVNQLIFNGSYFVGVQASRIFLQLSEQILTQTQLDVKATVTNTYYLVLIAEENRHVLKQTLENLEKTQFEVNELYKEGFTERTDVKQLQISVNALETGIRTLDQQIDISYQLLLLQMGLPIDRKIQLSDQLSDILEDLDLAERLDLQFNPYDNIGLKAIITQEQLADLTLKNEYSTFLPTIAAFASMQRDAQRDEFNIFDWDKKWYPTTVVGMHLSWPIFSGSSKLFRIQKARIELDQTRIQREKVEDGLEIQYKQARTELEEARDRFRIAGENRDLAREVYEITIEKYREGLVSSLELTQGHNQYLTAEHEYLQSVSDVLSARTKLDKILEIL